jgi:dTDP-4-dehydrorhamnose 3,5-epimerase-like enzyme
LKISELVTQTSPAHKDERRAIWEPVNGEIFRRMNFFDFAGATRPGGNHYHKRNTETFLLVEGKIIRMVIENVNTKDRGVFENLGPGTRIAMPTYHAHALFFAPGSKMLAACSEPFDENDQDLNSYKLMNEDGSVAV